MDDDNETDVDTNGTGPKDRASKPPTDFQQNGTFPTEHDPRQKEKTPRDTCSP